MKFIFNFIFFGLLFYLISIYFPDAFATLQSWALAIVNFAKDGFHYITEKMSSGGPVAPPPTP